MVPGPDQTCLAIHSVPIFAFVAADPFGLDILRCHRYLTDYLLPVQGQSSDSARASPQVSKLDVTWLGVKLRDVADLLNSEDGRHSQALAITEMDRLKATGLMRKNDVPAEERCV